MTDSACKRQAGSAGIERVPTVQPAGERLRIVVADDDEPTRVLLRTLIELAGMQVVGEAEDGGEAVELALEHEPDVVLLDVNMPVLDGLAAAERIRARRPRIRLLLHTGEPVETTLERAAALDLPLADKRDLHATIAELTRRTGTRQATATAGRSAFARASRGE